MTRQSKTQKKFQISATELSKREALRSELNRYRLNRTLCREAGISTRSLLDYWGGGNLMPATEAVIVNTANKLLSEARGLTSQTSQVLDSILAGA